VDVNAYGIHLHWLSYRDPMFFYTDQFGPPTRPMIGGTSSTVNGAEVIYAATDHRTPLAIVPSRVPRFCFEEYHCPLGIRPEDIGHVMVSGEGPVMMLTQEQENFGCGSKLPVHCLRHQ